MMKLKDFTDDLDMVEKMISKIIPILQKYAQNTAIWIFASCP